MSHVTVDAYGRLDSQAAHTIMDILAEDLGTTEIIKLFGERLKTAREKNAELEKVCLASNAHDGLGADRCILAVDNCSVLQQRPLNATPT